ncbi:MAG: glycosyltransferase, partial [Rhodothermales bacterium]
NAHVVCAASFGDMEEIVMGAAAAGRPIVAAAGTDLSPNTGLVVEPGDVRGLAGAIRRLIDDPELRRRLGHRARQLFDETYSPVRVAREFMSVYERLFEKGRRV